VHNCGNKAVRTDLLVDDVRPDLPRIMDDVLRRISFGVGRNNDEPVDHPVLDAIFKADFRPQRKLVQMARNQLGTVGAGNHYVEYAYAGRDVVVGKVLEILGATSTYEVHNHHNFAWREQHMGTDVWVVRKGCTPAFPGQEGFVGATMGEPAVILRGVESDDGASLPYSTVHGAGRVMSRTKAAGRIGNRAECGERDCDSWVTWAQLRHERERAGVGEHDRFTLCERHPHGRMVKRRGAIKEGAIDYAAVQAQLARGGIELRGGAADEAPAAYKRLDAVLAAHGDTVEILHRLTPIGVAMAGADTLDPYKD
jgi:tRNA-splicing ligase RtcB